MGVACQVAGLRFRRPKWEHQDWSCGAIERGIVPDKAARALRLRTPAADLIGAKLLDQDSLWSANDRGATFAQIADFIEANPEAVFTESK